MARERKYDFARVARELEEFFSRKINTVLGVTAVNFFRSNFDVEGFRDEGVKKWKPLSDARKAQKGDGKNILTNTGDLKRSIKWKPTHRGVVVYADEVYAEIHNEGGKISVTQKVSAHKRRTKWGVVDVKAHQREMNIDMPKRQFMGNSRSLLAALEQKVNLHINRILDKGQL